VRLLEAALTTATPATGLTVLLPGGARLEVREAAQAHHIPDLACVRAGSDLLALKSGWYRRASGIHGGIMLFIAFWETLEIESVGDRQQVKKGRIASPVYYIRGCAFGDDQRLAAVGFHIKEVRQVKALQLDETTGGQDCRMAFAINRRQRVSA